MTETTQHPIFLRKNELAKSLAVSPRTIDNWVARKMIPVLAFSPRLYRFDLEAVKAALKAQCEVLPDRRSGQA